MYEPQMTSPRLELIYCPHGYIEEICRLQFASTRMKCTIQTLIEFKIGYWICPKMSIIVIVWSLFDILLAVTDILSTWINERGLNTSTRYSTHIFTQLGGEM